MLKILPIILLSSAQKITYYAQYYAHDYCSYATVHVATYSLNIFNSYLYISKVGLQAVVFYIMDAVLQCSYVFTLLNIMLTRKLAPHFALCWHDYYV